VGVVLTLALEEVAEAAAHSRLAIAEHVPRETEARRDLILAMLDAAGRNALALFDHAVKRITRARNDRAIGRPAGRLDAHGASRVVFVHEEVILQQFAQREGRAEVRVSRAEFECQVRIDLPTVLPEKFQAIEAESAEKLAVALRDRSKVAEQ